MKKIAITLLLTIVLLCMPAPVLANSFGISPSSVELEVPKDGSATYDFTTSGFSGTVTIGLEDIPLEFEPHLIDVTDGEIITVTFYGDGTNNIYEGKITFLASMGEQVSAGIKVRLTVHINCSTKIVEPTPTPTPSRGGGGGGAAYHYTKTNIFGIEKNYRISNTGEILRPIEATSEDENLTITIPEGTIALDEDGKRLKDLQVAVDESAPDPPEDAHIIGLAYDFEPDGATFDPPITFTWSYDPGALPEGVAEENLVLAYYDEDADEWVELDCVVDTENNTIAASISHFTTFAIIGAVPPPPPAPAAFSVSSLSVKPLQVQPKEMVTITVSVANTGGTQGSYSVVLKINEVKEAEKKVMIAAGSSVDVSFSVTREEAGGYSVVVNGLIASFTVAAPEEEIVPLPVVPAKEINWPLVSGIIAGVIALGVLVFFLIRRRAY